MGACFFAHDLGNRRRVSHEFPWMSEQMLIKKEKNFFETRVTDYRTGGALQWD